MDEHKFCRSMLTELMPTVRKHADVAIRKEAWTYNYKNGRMEFQIPSKGIYWYGQTCCAWYARYKGWCVYLGSIGVKGYTLSL